VCWFGLRAVELHRGLGTSLTKWPLKKTNRPSFSPLALYHLSQAVGAAPLKKKFKIPEIAFINILQSDFVRFVPFSYFHCELTV
jgi:hypothetical protein